ncbi:MAG: hypothetical protein AAGA90_00660 [Actinomycetota bacterium]
MTERPDLGPGEDVGDIEALLRSAAMARPDADVEERLLLRMLDEIDVQREVLVSVDPRPVDVARIDRPGPRARRRPLIAAAAAIAIVAIGALIAVRGDATRPVSTTTDADGTDRAISLAPLERACGFHLPVLAEITRDEVPNDTLGGPLPALDAYDALVAAVTELGTAFDASALPDAGDLGSRLAELERLIRTQRDRYVEGRVASADVIADTLARRTEQLASEFADLGAAGCDPIGPAE